MCDLCGKEFEVLASLQKHKRYEHDTVLLDCVHCDKKFNLAKMKAHMFANHKNPGICGICGKKVNLINLNNKGATYYFFPSNPAIPLSKQFHTSICRNTQNIL